MAGNDYLEEIRFSTAAIGIVFQQVGLPTDRFATPPWMSRRFADSLIRCRSFEEVAVLVERNIRDAAAFLMTAFRLIEEIEKKEIALKRPLGVTEITAVGHAVITFLDEVERIHPEGLMEYERDPN